MKAPPFAYERVSSVAAASALLRRHGDAARLMAGGQTLLATLGMRLSEPSLVIDIGGIAELRGIAVTDRHLRIGALARHVDVERSAEVARTLPLLSLAAPHVAHAAIRNRGTFGGSIALADPAAEWPACAVAADGEVVVSDGAASRTVRAADFFRGLYQTDLRPHELVTAVQFPLPGPRRRFAFAELARRHGDYATVGLALAGDVVEGRLDDLRIVCFGVAATPVRARAAEAALAGSRGEPDAVDRAVGRLGEDLAPDGDLYASAATKLHLAGVLLRREIRALVTGEGQP
ncbi:FAD binding domain-containing protein [Azospirillum sp. ST 5-10]|uniref:FAD binding domain-containing protein n=1 Tax=unclassified Azospirillum TaxID=2630922 RepID=UPI003F4A1230